MIHSGSESIRLAKRFFAFFERGVTNAVFIVSGNEVGRGTTGTVEGYHTLGFFQSRKCLEAPLTSTIGGLIGNLEHWRGVVG